MFKKIGAFLKTSEGRLLLTITAIASFLRLYRFTGFVTFLGDQGRDAIIIKRIVTFEHLPAIGPSMSVGHVFLGPFYYYLVAPWLWVFNFHPVGLAFGVAVMSIASIIVSYFMIKDLFNKQVAIISTILMSTSAILIEFSRSSWNPNLLPYFTLFFIYFLIKAFTKKNYLFFLLAGAFLSLSMQLHYLALLLVPIAALYFLINLFETKKFKETIVGGLLFSAAFLFFSAPLIIFDLRHQFINSKSFLKLFNSTENVSPKNLDTVTSTFEALNKFIFNYQFAKPLLIVLLVLIAVGLINELRKKTTLRPFLLFFFLLLLGVSFYNGPKHPHYLGVLFTPYILIISYFLSQLLNSRVGKTLVGVFLIGYIYLNYQGYYFLDHSPNFQINHAKRVANQIYDAVNAQPYQVTSLPYYVSDEHYRYFLELSDKKPLERDSLEKPKVLYVICEGDCKPIGDPQWNIAFFAANKVSRSWKVDNVKIYELAH